MGYVRSRKFCCCLPVRFGVFVMSILGIVGGGAIAGFEWVQVVHLKDHPTMLQKERIGIIMNTIIWSLICITSIFGLIGTITKRRGFVSTYSSMLFSLLGFSIFSGIFYIHTLFDRTVIERTENDCIGGSTSTIKIDACKASYDLGRGLTIVVYIVLWLVMLYGCMIVANYVGQLHEEEEIDSAKAPMVSSISAPGPTQPATTYGYYQQPAAGQYPYGTPQNAFGNSSSV